MQWYIQSPSHHIKSSKADKADARQQQAIPRDAMCNSGRLLGRKAIAGTLSCVKELLVSTDAETGDSFEQVARTTWQYPL